MEQHVDYTKTFQSLTLDKSDGQSLFSHPDYHHWHERWQIRLAQQSKSRAEVKAFMKAITPLLFQETI